MANGLLIHPDGSTEMRTVGGYKDIIAAVGGDFDWTSQSDIICYCYEYALFERLVNPIATAVYWAHNGVTTAPLAGEVLILGMADSEGNETDVPEIILQQVEVARERFGPDGIAAAAIKLDPAEIPQPQVVFESSPRA